MRVEVAPSPPEPEPEPLASFNPADVVAAPVTHIQATPPPMPAEEDLDLDMDVGDVDVDVEMEADADADVDIDIGEDGGEGVAAEVAGPGLADFPGELAPFPGTDGGASSSSSSSFPPPAFGGTPAFGTSPSFGKLPSQTMPNPLLGEPNRVTAPALDVTFDARPPSMPVENPWEAPPAMPMVGRAPSAAFGVVSQAVGHGGGDQPGASSLPALPSLPTPPPSTTTGWGSNNPTMALSAEAQQGLIASTLGAMPTSTAPASPESWGANPTMAMAPDAAMALAASSTARSLTPPPARPSSPPPAAPAGLSGLFDGLDVPAPAPRPAPAAVDHVADEGGDDLNFSLEPGSTLEPGVSEGPSPFDLAQDPSLIHRLAPPPPPPPAEDAFSEFDGLPQAADEDRQTAEPVEHATAILSPEVRNQLLGLAARVDAPTSTAAVRDFDALEAIPAAPTTDFGMVEPVEPVEPVETGLPGADDLDVAFGGFGEPEADLPAPPPLVDFAVDRSATPVPTAHPLPAPPAMDFGVGPDLPAPPPFAAAHPMADPPAMDFGVDVDLPAPPPFDAAPAFDDLPAPPPFESPPAAPPAMADLPPPPPLSALDDVGLDAEPSLQVTSGAEPSPPDPMGDLPAPPPMDFSAAAFGPPSVPAVVPPAPADEADFGDLMADLAAPPPLSTLAAVDDDLPAPPPFGGDLADDIDAAVDAVADPGADDIAIDDDVPLIVGSSVSSEGAPVEEPVEAAPVEAAPVEAAPVEAAPVEAAPVEEPAAPPVALASEPPASTLSARVGTLAESLEDAGRYADAALLYEVQGLLSAAGR